MAALEIMEEPDLHITSMLLSFAIVGQVQRYIYLPSQRSTNSIVPSPRGSKFPKQPCQTT